MKHISSVQLQIYLGLIRQAFNLLGIKSFNTAEGISESLEEASFINTQSIVERIPITYRPGQSAGEDLGNNFRELLLLTLDMIEELDDVLKRPHRFSRLSMIGEIREFLSNSEDSRRSFMNLFRIRAQKPG